MIVLINQTVVSSGTRVIGRFHHQQAKEPAKWLNLGPGLGEASSRFILEKICYHGIKG
jgi:hypothetical protein